MSEPTLDRCEPPEHLRGVDGWHWVQAPGHHVRVNPFPVLWWGCWLWNAIPGSSTKAYAAGYRYIAPVATPEEVEALRAERDDALKFQGEAHRLRTGNKLLADTVRAWGWENRTQESNGELIGRALHELRAEANELRTDRSALEAKLTVERNYSDTLRARVETLEAALRCVVELDRHHSPSTTDGRDWTFLTRTFADIARAALEGKPHE